MTQEAIVLVGDCRDRLRDVPSESVRTCVTSPPYFGLRDYGVSGQIGREPTPEEFVAALVEVFREVRRTLTPDGTLWLNLGDSYAAQGGPQVDGTKQAKGSQAGAWGGGSRKPAPGLKAKDLIGIPWMAAFALRADGWFLRSDVIWAKPNPMPSSVRDRPTSSHEHLFLLTKSPAYFYDADAIKEPMAEASAARYRYGFGGKKATHLVETDQNRTAPIGERDVGDGLRNKRDVWTVPVRAFRGAHFATYPPDLIRPCVLAGSAPGDVVLDPFNGAGTTGLVALEVGRSYLGIELNPEYAEITRGRLAAWNPEIVPAENPLAESGAA